MERNPGVIMNKTPKDRHHEQNPTLPDRRRFLAAGAGVAAATLLSCNSRSSAAPGEQGAATTTGAGSAPQDVRPERRKLGQLEVSSVGLGVQNMSRKYETTVPYRPQMINIIRAAFDRGVTFFDAAEAYGPWEVERILGEGIKPFGDKVVITSKFGWNVDQQTGQRLPGLNSRPAHVKVVVDNMLRSLQTDRIDLLYQHRVDPQVPIEDVAGAVQDLMKQGRCVTGDFRKWASRRSAAARHGRAERILDAVGRTGAGGDPYLRGAWNRLRALESSRRAVPDRLDRREHPLRSR
jgi:hypothetical protein